MLIFCAIIVVLLVTGRSVEIGKMAQLTAEAVTVTATGQGQSQVAQGLAKIGTSLWPLQISETTQTSRIDSFDRSRLPWLAHIETRTQQTQVLNPETLELESVSETVEYLVEPLGYLRHVAIKLIETLEIALWGTVIAVLISIPLAFFSASNMAPDRIIYTLARSVVSFLRAVPELVSALFLVLAYGFGPIAGVLALALHAAGFLGKFYAEDIENADIKPQEALAAIGANRIKVLRFAILPQVMAQYTAYTLYVLDRNFRMATVIGLVGAGGIGQELKGRFDMYNYHHVGTILVAIFCTVFVIDQLSARIRRRLF
jgi:phosphonate transport system permease protein